MEWCLSHNLRKGGGIMGLARGSEVIMVKSQEGAESFKTVHGKQGNSLSRG